MRIVLLALQLATTGLVHAEEVNLGEVSYETLAIRPTGEYQGSPITNDDEALSYANACLGMDNENDQLTRHLLNLPKYNNRLACLASQPFLLKYGALWYEHDLKDNDLPALNIEEDQYTQYRLWVRLPTKVLKWQYNLNENQNVDGMTLYPSKERAQQSCGKNRFNRLDVDEPLYRTYLRIPAYACHQKSISGSGVTEVNGKPAGGNYQWKSGDTFSVGDGGHVSLNQINADGYIQAKVGEKSKVKWVIDKSGGLIASIFRGVMHLNEALRFGSEGRINTKIRIPTATIGIRGTEFTTAVLPDKTSSEWEQGTWSVLAPVFKSVGGAGVVVLTKGSIYLDTPETRDTTYQPGVYLIVTHEQYPQCEKLCMLSVDKNIWKPEYQAAIDHLSARDR